jgi:hypothetical protein
MGPFIDLPIVDYRFQITDCVKLTSDRIFPIAT